MLHYWHGRSTKKLLFIVIIQFFYLGKTACAELETRIEIREPEHETKESFQKKWVAPTHRVPIIECAYDENNTISATLMFLAGGFQRSGPCIRYQLDKYKNTLHRFLRDSIKPSEPKDVVPDVVIEIMTEYAGALNPKDAYEELQGKRSNSWILFEEHIGIPSLSPKITTLNPVDFYRICIEQEQYHFRQEWSDNAHHHIIKMKLNDLQKIAAIQRAFNPFAFTINREVTLGSNTCMCCGTKYRVQPEEGMWIEIDVTTNKSDAISDAIVDQLQVPHQIKINCSGCNNTSLVWCTRKFDQYPLLLMLLMLTKDRTHKAKVPEHLTIGDAAFKLCNTVGDYDIDNDIESYVVFHNKELAYYDDEYNTYSNQRSADRPLAALYQLQEPAQQEEQHLPRKTPCECIIL